MEDRERVPSAVPRASLPAEAPSGSRPVDAAALVLGMQRTHGNQAVQRLVSQSRARVARQDDDAGIVSGPTDAGAARPRKRVDFRFPAGAKWQSPWFFGMTNEQDERVTVRVTTSSADGATQCQVALLNQDTQETILPAPIPAGSPQLVLFTNIPDGDFYVVITAAGGTVSGDGYVDVPGP
jgi:hypothetical protein